MRHSHGLGVGEGLSKLLDALNFMQGFCCNVTLATIRTANDLDPLDNEKVSALAIASSNAPTLYALFATDITDHVFHPWDLPCIHRDDNHFARHSQFCRNYNPSIIKGRALDEVLPLFFLNFSLPLNYLTS